MKCIREKSFSYDVLLLLWIFTAIGFGVLQKTNFHRINAIHMAMFILLEKGIILCCKKRRCIKYVLAVLYSISFILFEGYYFTVYQDIISERQLAGAGEALERAEELYEAGKYDKIHITGQLRHSHVLFYTQYPTNQYVNEVRWKNYPDKYLVAKSFGSYYWDDEQEALEETGIYIIRKAEFETYEESGYAIEPFGYCGVAYKE